MTLNEYLENNVDKHSFAKKIGLKYVNALYKYLNGMQIPAPRIMKKIFKVTGGQVTANDFYSQ